MATWPTPSLSDGYLVAEGDWNLHVDNLNDLNTRVGTGNGTDLASRVSTLESGKVATTRTISTTNGLQGGGDLSANLTLSPVYGTSANTVAQGNDSRITVTQDASIGNSALGTRVTALEAQRNAFFYSNVDQNVPNTTEQKVKFELGSSVTGLATKNAANDTITLVKGGLWMIEVGLRFGPITYVGSPTGERFFRITNGGTGTANAYKNKNEYRSTGQVTMTGDTFVAPFAANATISITVQHNSGTSTAAGDAANNAVIQGSVGGTVVHVSLTYLGGS